MRITSPQDVAGLEWTRSTFAKGTAWLEMATMPGDTVAVRRSSQPDIVIVYTKAEIQAFLEGAQKGEFDDI